MKTNLNRFIGKPDFLFSIKVYNHSFLPVDIFSILRLVAHHANSCGIKSADLFLWSIKLPKNLPFFDLEELAISDLPNIILGCMLHYFLCSTKYLHVLLARLKFYNLALISILVIIFFPSARNEWKWISECIRRCKFSVVDVGTRNFVQCQYFWEWSSKRNASRLSLTFLDRTAFHHMMGFCPILITGNNLNREKCQVFWN